LDLHSGLQFDNQVVDLSPKIMTQLARRQLQFDLTMIENLLRDFSVAFAYLKVRNDTVTEIHQNLLRVIALNKYIVH